MDVNLPHFEIYLRLKKSVLVVVYIYTAKQLLTQIIAVFILEEIEARPSEMIVSHGSFACHAVPFLSNYYPKTANFTHTKILLTHISNLQKMQVVAPYIQDQKYLNQLLYLLEGTARYAGLLISIPSIFLK